MYKEIYFGRFPLRFSMFYVYKQSCFETQKIQICSIYYLNSTLYVSAKYIFVLQFYWKNRARLSI